MEAKGLPIVGKSPTDWFSKFTGFEKNSFSFGTSLPASTSSVCNSRAVNQNLSFINLEAMSLYDI